MEKRHYITKLSELLNESDRKCALYNERRVAIFGAGNTSALYEKCFDAEKINPTCYFDNEKKKWGIKMYGGGYVYSPSEITADMLVLISSRNIDMFSAISQQLDEIGVAHMGVDEYVFAKRKNEIIKCAELLDDEKSIEMFTKLVECRIKNISVPDHIFERDQYFCLPTFYAYNPKEIFVDCGAFVGDTLEQFLFKHFGSFKRIVAFEPDAKNFSALQKRMERLKEEWALEDGKITAVKSGVGKKSECIGLVRSDNGAGSRFSSSTVEADSMVYALDDYFKDKSVTFIKADIESYELDMLIGAEKIIRRDRPKLAIAIYHNASDMYQILLWLHSLGMGYKFAVRHHTPDLYDTILYAY